MPGGPLHGGAPSNDGDSKVAAGKMHEHRFTVLALTTRNEDCDRGASARAASEREADASLPDRESNRAVGLATHQLDVGTVVERRMNFHARPEPLDARAVVLPVLDREKNRVGIAGIGMNQRHALARDVERSLIDDARLAHVDADIGVAARSIERHGAEPGVGLEHPFEMRGLATASHVESDAPKTVAAHLGDRSVGVHDAHPRHVRRVFGRKYQENAIAADAETSVAEAPGKRRRHRVEAGRVDDEEVVAEAFVLVEVDAAHGAPSFGKSWRSSDRLADTEPADGAGEEAASKMSRLRFLTAGESHGPRLVAIVEGVPAGLRLSAADIDADLARRQRGYGRGGRQKIERDAVEIFSGVRGGETLGSPIALSIVNRDFDNWRDRMGAEPFPSPPEPVTRPRPGHADLAGGLKYDRHDLRDVLERASARETAARTAAGAVARKLLDAIGIDVFAIVTAIGAVKTPDFSSTDDAGLDALRARARASDLACGDAETETSMRAAILAASHDGDTLGGAFTVIARGVPAGFGSHVHWDRKLDGRLAQAVMSIQAIKAVAIGNGPEVAANRGSQVHDPIGYDAARRAFTRPSNHAGGVEGGISNGEPVIVRGWMKPIATLRKALTSVDVTSKESFDAAFERSDICAVAAASVVAEAMVCLALADAALEKLGGDSMGELLRNLASVRTQLAEY